MRITQLIITTLCFTLMASVAAAQDKKAAKPVDHQVMMEMYQKLAAPGEQHKLLADLAGSWGNQDQRMDGTRQAADGIDRHRGNKVRAGRALFAGELHRQHDGATFQWVIHHRL